MKDIEINVAALERAKAFNCKKREINVHETLSDTQIQNNLSIKARSVRERKIIKKHFFYKANKTKLSMQDAFTF